MPNAGGPGPGGFGGGGPGLLVRVDGPDKRFPAGQQVRIGREPGLEVVCDDPAVSRQHALVEPRPDGWWLVDRSTAGTFVNGERITQYKLEEPTEVLLGHPTAGYELELVPVVAAGVAAKSIAKKKRRRTLAIVAAAVAVLLVVGGGVAAAILLGDDDGGSDTAGGQQSDEGGAGLSEDELNRAKAATVLLTAFGPDGQPTHTGSGSVISDDGLILTNAHVADPAAPGQGGDDLEYLEVSFTSSDDDAPVEPRYRAVPIVSDGYLDITVAQIVADLEGNEVDGDDLDLPEPLEIGDSDELRTGDEITALGYPSLSQANSMATAGRALTVTKGSIATFNSSEVIGSNRAEIDADIRIGSGNSGGPSINDAGEIVALNTRVFTETLGQQLEGEGGIFTGGSARLVPINLGQEVLDIGRDGGDPDYVSPFLEAVPDPEQEMTNATIEAHGWAIDGEQGSCTGTSTVEEPQILPVAPGDVVFAEFIVTGLADGTPFTIELLDAADAHDPAHLGAGHLGRGQRRRLRVRRLRGARGLRRHQRGAARRRPVRRRQPPALSVAEHASEEATARQTHADPSVVSRGAKRPPYTSDVSASPHDNARTTRTPGVGSERERGREQDRRGSDEQHANGDEEQHDRQREEEPRERRTLGSEPATGSSSATTDGHRRRTEPVAHVGRRGR